MTNSIHDTSIKVSIYPDEFVPLLRLLNRAISNDDVMKYITDDEAAIISGVLDELQNKALEFGV